MLWTSKDRVWLAFITSFFVVLMLCFTIGYFGYTSFGKTYSGVTRFSGATFAMSSHSSHTIVDVSFGETGEFCVTVNSTQNPFIVVTDINGIKSQTTSYSNSTEMCSMNTHPHASVTVTNLSNETTVVTYSVSFDTSPVRFEQMQFAPWFTVTPLLLLLGFLGTTKKRSLRIAYYGGILPFLVTLILLQISVIAHSASGGQYIKPAQYFWLPFSYFQFFLTPSPMLFSLLFHSTLLWIFSLVGGALLLVSIFVVLQIHGRTSRKLSRLLLGTDLVGLLSYYYLAGALYWITLTGIATYGPKEFAQFFSVPYSETLITPITSLFGLFPGSELDVLYLAELGVTLAILTRLWVIFSHNFPYEAFAKALTLVSIASILALSASPKITANYYASLAVMGFSAIPFFALSVVVALVHWGMGRYLGRRKVNVREELVRHLNSLRSRST